MTWPNKMNVAVYEKAIVGYISYMGCNMYFDKDGIVVESSSENYEDVPQITGLDFKSIVRVPNSRSVTMRSFHRFWN